MNNALSGYSAEPNNAYGGVAPGQDQQPVPITQLRKKIDIVRATRVEGAGLRPATGS